MSCPAWEKCQKKACIEQERCWKTNGLVGLSAEGIRMISVIKPIKVSLCKKVADVCDKHDTCRLLGQCIFTLNSVKTKKLKMALRGTLTLKEVIKILSKHNPKPMRSYYLHSKKKK